ncbi:unnamed protein product [Leuciscus chuanchicus]
MQNEFDTTTQIYLTCGVFSFSPCFGILAPGAQQVVTVDCKADHEGSWEECLAIDITDRDPSDNPDGIPYKQLYLLAFNNVLVGLSAKAKFRLTNPGKVSCELSLAIKTAKNTMHNEVFELNPAKMCIPSHSHAFATVTFSPLTIVTASSLSTFDLMGEGNLPSITPVLQFKRLLVGRGQTLPLVIKNNGNVPAQVSLVLQRHLEVFTLKAAPGTVCRLASSHTESNPGKEPQLAHVASLILMTGQQAEFQVGFHPKVAQKFEASMKLMVQLVGAGYHDIIILDNTGSKVQQDSIEKTFTMTNPSSSKVLRFEWLPNGPQLSFSPKVGHLHAECSKVVTVTFCSEQPIVLNAQTIKCKLSSITFHHNYEIGSCNLDIKWQFINKSQLQDMKHVQTLNFSYNNFNNQQLYARLQHITYSIDASKKSLICRLTGNRRIPEPHSSLTVDPDTRVIEITSVGIGTSVRREFGIINPTNKPYSFIWRCDDSGKSPFSCLTPNKSVQLGKEAKVLNLDLVESFWTFLTPEHKLSLPFLLVGSANEPIVYIDRAHLNLGSLLLGFEAHQTVFVVNGDYQPFHFMDILVVEPMEGTVPPKDKYEPTLDMVTVGGQSYCNVTFCPHRKCVLKDLTFSIKITFCCALMGSAMTPDLEFSFPNQQHHFGMHLIYCVGMVPATHTLGISSKGVRKKLFFFFFFFLHDNIQVLKCVNQSRLFSNTPVLEVTSTPQVLPPGGSVKVLFSFYPHKAVRYHEKVFFEMNKGAKQVVEILVQGTVMKINLEDSAHKVVNFGALQIGQRSQKLVPLVNSSHSSLTFCLRRHSDNSLQGSRRGAAAVVELLFSPEERMPPFIEELHLECLGAIRPLLVMKGSCKGVEVTLDTDYLQFGAVVQRCQATRRIIMQNTGDIGLQYMTPGTEVSLEVTYAPTELSQDLRYDGLCCAVRGRKTVKTHPHWLLHCPAGRSRGKWLSMNVANFGCQVRSQCTQSLVLPGPIKRWTLKCVIEGEHWSGPPTLLIESNAKPTTHRHLPVHNWLPRPQRFRSVMELIKPDRSDGIVSLKGLEYIDVHALDKRTKLSFFTYKEGQYNAKVTFKNEATGEFLFYNLNFKATALGLIDTIEMATRVRQMTSEFIEVENPLLVDVSFSAEFRHQISATVCCACSVYGRYTFRNTKFRLTFEYKPLCEGESTARLLQLKALPAPLEKPLYFRAPLGSKHSVKVKLTNFTRVKTKYICKMDNPNFTVEKNIKAAAGNQTGTDISVSVHFEPCQVGDIQSQLIISSDVGGGVCLPSVWHLHPT